MRTAGAVVGWIYQLQGQWHNIVNAEETPSYQSDLVSTALLSC